jgi:alpha-tubulin suppressor-like RCC1 family protein
MDINKRLFRKLSEYFKDNIKLSFIAEKNVIIVTKDDRVYHIWEYFDNTYSSIAYTCDESVVRESIEKSIVEELCEKGVADIKKSLMHNIARTSDGKVYVWGVCVLGELGNGFCEEKVYKPEMNQFLNDFNIIDMSCGFHHTIVLTSSGGLYGWGCNIFGQTGNSSYITPQLIPFKMNSLMSEKFKAISCGACHSMALTVDGRVFGCGQNKFGQLGDRSAGNSNKLKLINMNGVIVEKISCGLSQTFMLSTDGDIYSFGQLNNQLDENKNEFYKLNNSIKFRDIASHYTQNFLAALSISGLCYVWGECKHNKKLIFTLQETQYKSLKEIFLINFQITDNAIEGTISEFEDSFFRTNYYENTYVEIEKLGEGSYGEVFKVDNKLLPSKVNNKNIEDFKFIAVKKIKFKNENEKEILKELEIYCLVSNIIGKNILRYYEFWIEKNLTQKFSILNIEMELCEQTLNEFIKSLHELKLEEYNISENLKYFISCEIFVEILEGVNYLHKQNPPIIHRDLCPDNILIICNDSNEVVVKIADFGLVTIHKFAEQLHEPDVGHIEYLAPEVLRDGGDYETRADIYSLGVILKDLFPIDSDERYYFYQTFNLIDISL